jgi:outer membrane lipoprotein-sorting protein
MKTIKASLFTLSALLSLTIAKAQTADDIIAKHIDAVGGKDKISQVTSMYIESNTNIMNMDAPSKTYIVTGKGYRTESDFNGQKLVQVITDKGGWSINPFLGGTTPTAMSDDDYQGRAEDINAVDPLVNYAANGAKVTLAGQEKVGDVNAYKLQLTNKFNKETDFYIDPATWYVIKMVSTATMMGQPTTITTTLSNYQKTDFGIVMPYSISTDFGQAVLAVTVQKVEVNKQIDPTIFDMPKS